MPKKIDMVGRRFGRLTVTRVVSSVEGNHELRYECRCQCGNVVLARGASLRRGTVKSCGCWRRDGYRERWVCYDGNLEALLPFFRSLVDEAGWRRVEAVAEGPDKTMRLRYFSQTTSVVGEEIRPYTLLRLSDDGETVETKRPFSPGWCRIVVSSDHRDDVLESGEGRKE